METQTIEDRFKLFAHTQAASLIDFLSFVTPDTHTNFLKITHENTFERKVYLKSEEQRKIQALTMRDFLGLERNEESKANEQKEKAKVKGVLNEFLIQEPLKTRAFKEGDYEYIQTLEELKSTC